jgi:hypothetical protein
MHPEVLSSMSEPLIKKISRAVREGRGARVQLHDREREVLGGKIDWKKLGQQAKSVSKMLARPAISGATSALTTAGLTALGQPELAPLVAPMASYAVNKALDKAHLGFGTKSKLKKFAKVALFGVQDDATRAGLKSVGHEEYAPAVLPLSSQLSDMYGGKYVPTGKPVGRPKKEKPEGYVERVKRKYVRKVKSDEPPKEKRKYIRKVPYVKKSKSESESKPETETKGEGAKKRRKRRSVKYDSDSESDSESDEEEIKPSHVRKMLIIHLAPHMHSIEDAMELASDMMTKGCDCIDSHHLGGSLSSMIKKGAKKLYHYAKPVIKYFGEQAIEKGAEYARPALEEALGAMASQYGVDPSIVKMGTDTFLSAGEQMAKDQLRRHTDVSQAPVHSHRQPPSQTMHSLQNRTQDVSDPFTYSAPPSHSQSAFSGFGLKHVYDSSGRVPIVYGGAIQTHMSTLMDSMNPSLIPFHSPPNLPQGQVSGGSFRAGYGMRRKYGGSFV